MARKSVLTQTIGGANVGHPHCELCGACLQYENQRHACPGEKPIDPEVLEVFLADCRPKDGRRIAVKVPEGFQIERG